MNLLNATHDPDLRSWVPSANDPATDFPIQNLPFGRFQVPGAPVERGMRIGIAIGDQVLDLRAAGLLGDDDMNALMAAPPSRRQSLRTSISAGLAEGSGQQQAWTECLLPQASVEMALPCDIGNYTDFYVGIHHAIRVGTLFRPDHPLLPNYKHVPIGYHGRSSSIRVSGHPVARPHGQVKRGTDAPVLDASERLDYELELGILVGTGNGLGEPIALQDAEDHLFGVTLLNDWSARDVQAWEYQPLGPFLSKNFMSTLSPWVVTMEALAPFRAPRLQRGTGDPQPLAYLDSARDRTAGAFDITLEAWLQTSKMRMAGEGPVRLTTAAARDAAYWTPAQLITHHTVNGCNLQPGDLLGSGTLSGPAADESGSLLELSVGGKHPVALPNGEQRSFLEDGDTVILRGYCEREGATRIGLGACVGTVAAARRSPINKE